jgi:hypothetical protein
VLVDWDDARRDRRLNRREHGLLAVQGKHAAVRLAGADDDLDQGALAGAVLAEKRMHGTRPQPKGRVTQGVSLSVALGDVFCRENDVNASLHRT